MKQVSNNKPVVATKVVATVATAAIPASPAPLVPVATTILARAIPAARYAAAQRITVLAKSCPKRPGTKAAHKWSLYATCPTVGEFLAAGGTRSCLLWDTKHGFIQVEPIA